MTERFQKKKLSKVEGKDIKKRAKLTKNLAGVAGMMVGGCVIVGKKMGKGGLKAAVAVAKKTIFKA